MSLRKSCLFSCSPSVPARSRMLRKTNFFKISFVAPGRSRMLMSLRKSQSKRGGNALTSALTLAHSVTSSRRSTASAIGLLGAFSY